MEIVLRKALPSDFAEVARIGRETFYETWRPVNTEEDMQEYMKSAFDPGKIKKDLEDRVNTFFLAHCNGELTGYSKLRRDRSYPEFQGLSALEIERIYVYKSWQDKKVGKAMMDFCIQLAKEERMHWLWLGVNMENIKAIDFYKRYGFTIFGEKEFQLGEAMDKDYLMWLEIGSGS